LMGIVKENKTKQTLRLSTQFSVRRGGERGGRGGGGSQALWLSWYWFVNLNIISIIFIELDFKIF
jgi:hypothetical protein